MAALTKEDLRDYVMLDERVVADGYVLLDMRHNLTTRQFAEIRFHVETDIEDVRFRIYAHCGTKPEFMELVLHGKSMEDGHLLRDYNPKDNDIIHVIDHDPDSAAANGWLDDITLVQRYEMPDEQYDKLPNTYRAWKKKQLAEDPNWLPPWVKKQVEEAAAKRAEKGLESLESVQERFKIDDRCECRPGGRRGEVKYIGYAHGQAIKTPTGEILMPQVWIGVKFDEPVGKNDGTSKGKRYFTAGRNYGAFVKPENVIVGDFPERDPFASDCSDDDNDGQDGDNQEDLMEEL